MDINAVTFRIFSGTDRRQLLVRTFTVAPEIVEGGKEKRGKRTVPSPEQMEQTASDAGVGDLYRQFTQALLAAQFKVSNAKTTRVFQAKFPGGSSKVVLSLVPGESSGDKGLRYRLLSNRLAEYLGVDQKEVLDHLPPNPEPYQQYADDAQGEYKGWAGYIKGEADIQKIADLVKQGRRDGSGRTAET